MDIKELSNLLNILPKNFNKKDALRIVKDFMMDEVAFSEEEITEVKFWEYINDSDTIEFIEDVNYDYLVDNGIIEDLENY